MEFLGKCGRGSAFGNQVERKYLVSTRYAKNAASEAEPKKFQAVVGPTLSNQSGTFSGGWS